MVGFEFDADKVKAVLAEYYHETGLAEGRAEGRAEGVAEGILEVAKNLLTLKTPIETIVKATNFTEEQVLKLAAEMKLS